MKYQEYRTYLEDELTSLNLKFKDSREAGMLPLEILHGYVRDHLGIDVIESERFMYDPHIDEFKAEIDFDGGWRERFSLARIIAKESAATLGFDEHPHGKSMQNPGYEHLLAIGLLIDYDDFKQTYEANICDEGSNIWYYLALKFGVSSVVTETYFKHRDKFAFDMDMEKPWCARTYYKDTPLYTTDANIASRNARIKKHIRFNYDNF